MTDDNGTTGERRDEGGRWRGLRPSRRRFLEGAAAAGAVASLGGVSFGQETAIELDGHIDAWEGVAPAEIEGEDNPTLTLEPDTEYTVEWENVDGQPHNFAILDDAGEAVVSSEIISEQGATQTVEFTASEEMSEYLCEVHPTSMRGDLQVGDATGSGGEETAGLIPPGPSVGLQQVAGEPLIHPVSFQPVPGEDDTRLIADQLGQVYRHDADGLDEEPILDLSPRLEVLTDAAGGFERAEGFDERGLLGLAFHPDFEENRLLYVRYSAPLTESETAELAGPPDREGFSDEFDHKFVLAEFEVGEDVAEIDVGSERVLLEIPEPQFNHNAGDLAFGPDGYLYVAVGDGGDANDTGIGHVEDWYGDNEGGNGQDVEQNLLGSILRIDVDSEGDDRPYGIPDDNPLVDGPGLDEHYAWGLRNPWRMSFDSEGRLFVADVGQGLWEEVNIVERGGNYGWNVKEGAHCFSTENPQDPPEQCPTNAPDEPPYDGQPLEDPVIEYPHTYQGQTVGISITGGYVYEGDQLSEVQGDYVFADWSRGFAEPLGRLFVASPPELDGGGAGNETGNATTGNETGNLTAGNATDNATVGNATDDATTGNATGNATTGNATTDNATGNATDNATDASAGNETVGNATGGNETTGNATAGNATGNQTTGDATAGGQGEDALWTIRELTVEGGENDEINRFIQSFGRDADDELYVLTSTTGRLTQGTGEIYRIVPSGEGDEISAPEVEAPTGDDDGDEDETAGNESGTDNQTAPDNQTMDNATAGNETGNATMGNETGNATDNATGNTSE